MAGSQAFTANLATCKTSVDSGADAATIAARALAAAGPITDVDAMLALLQTKANEMATIIDGLCAGTTGILRTGDGSAANNYALLQNIRTSLVS